VGVLLVGGFFFAWSGIYNVAASRDHLPFTRVLLEFALRSSVRTHSIGIETPPLDDADLVRLGASHFSTGCSVCHGAPGEPAGPQFASMLPPPPSLVEAAPKWKPARLFWIVKHGLKYTGMPAWPTQQRDDEVWAMVAFLQKLPMLGIQDYRALARIRPPRAGAGELVQSGKAPSVGPCARCHDDEDSPTTSRLVPKLAGQRAAYLESALRSYATGARSSGLMQQIAARLDQAEIREVSEYYASLKPKTERHTSEAMAAARIDRGRQIAEAGVAAAGIPPCMVCHSDRARDTFPRLAGQHFRYLETQLNLWRKGLRTGTVTGAIMAPIARRLTDEQIADVAAYFSSLSPQETQAGPP
jgi:cytochrome c553